MRRPVIRSLAGGAAGIAIGVTAGIVLTSVSAAGPSLDSGGPPVIEAAHVPALLTVPGEPIRLRYAIVCAPREDGRPCDGSGTVYIRSGQAGQFRPLRLRRGEESKDGRYYVDVPAVDSDAGFSYYAVLRDDATGATLTVPSGGAEAPQVSLPLFDTVKVSLGRHSFGHVRAPDEQVAHAGWGPAPQEIGLAGSRELGFSGPSSFDVEPDGTVDVLDSVKKRVMRWTRGGRAVVRVPGATELADFAVEPDGAFDLLDARGSLHRFEADGTPKWAQKLSDRTWAKLAQGPTGPVVLQQPSEQWLPVAERGVPLGRADQARGARAGRPLANGREILVDRVGEKELRIAETNGKTPLRAWRITSDTPLGEVQLAEPHGDDIVVVTRAYTENSDEFVVLELDRTGLVATFSLASDSWTETAPLARLRLARGSLYRLRTTQTGVFVDRFGLEETR